MECKHKYKFMGLVYWEVFPNKAAILKTRMYADKFYCKKCLHTKYVNERKHGTDADYIIKGAVPK